ncbi:MAG: hypothetical protein NC926_10695, partial [Candidatus Omnitrophica bacterium]|nr:hypothetical protein [Candidatus Omnitrophota bacterium]
VYDDSGRLRRIRLNEDINETGLYLVVKYPAVWNTADEAFLELADKVPEALVFDTYGEISFPFHYSEIQTEKEREIWWSVLGFTKDQLRNDVELQGKVKNKWKVAKEL